MTFNYLRFVQRQPSQLGYVNLSSTGRPPKPDGWFQFVGSVPQDMVPHWVGKVMNRHYHSCRPPRVE